jgi:hypothetical protein
MSVSVDIRDRATGGIKGLIAGASAGNVNPAIGAAITKLFQDHYLAQPSNKQQWPTTNFWARAARATHWTLLADGVVISTSQQGILQRYYGGEIKPVNAKHLAIPARAEAYGKSPKEFDDLSVAFTNKGGKPTPFALVQNVQTPTRIGPKRKDGTREVTHGETIGGAVYFWLVDSVTQKGDPDIIPSEQEMGDAAEEQVSAAIDRALRRTGV